MQPWLDKQEKGSRKLTDLLCIGEINVAARDIVSKSYFGVASLDMSPSIVVRDHHVAS